MPFTLPRCLSFLALLPLLISAQKNNNITLSSSLIAGNESSSWVSPSGDFAFGFQQVGNNTGSFIVAIWFNKIPEKTVLWSAYYLAQRGSKLQLTSDGRLVLSDLSGKGIWSPTLGGGAAYAAMLNTGNFVVTGKNLVILWQSFDHPTDTILPTQTLDAGTSLMAHYSESNYSSGRFKLSMQQNGSLVFYKIDEPHDLKYYSVYEETSSAGSGNQVAFDQSGLIYVRAKNGSKTSVVLQDLGTTDDLYQRAVLEFDGFFRRYTYPRSNSKSWPMAWSIQSFVPQDICTSAEGGACLPIGGDHKKDHRTVILVESVFLGSSVILNILLLSLAVLLARICTYRKGKLEPKENQDIPGTNMRNFTYKELEECTNGFEEVVGRGAFATVYKGALDSEEGNVIAVKKLNEQVKENQREFESEVQAIARTGHRNLVQLIGFCNEQQHRLLVYEYMPNGSLAGVLFQGQRLNWFLRMKFALETARGLSYLHEECSIQIMHCDIKLQNVLLDDSLTARISDFGLAKSLKIDQTHTMTGIRGTKGYVAPEWFRSVPITTKVDVYSYGILLLELVCCRRCFEANMEDENQKVLADWAYDCYKEGRVDKLVESDNEAMEDIENVKKFVLIALWCVQEDPSLRPLMKKVVEMIQGPIEEPLPPDLASHINSISISISMNGVYKITSAK